MATSPNQVPADITGQPFVGWVKDEAAIEYDRFTDVWQEVYAEIHQPDDMNDVTYFTGYMAYVDAVAEKMKQMARDEWTRKVLAGRGK